jgi:hypothetical protein
MARQVIAILIIFLVSIALSVHPSTAQLSAGFIENRGQVDPQVLFYSSGSGATVYLTAEAIVLDLREQEPEHETGGEALADIDRHGPRGILGRVEEEAAPRRGCAIWVRFEGANPSPLIEAREELPGKYNFFLGIDPAKWRTEVPAFREVVSRDVWPGVDLIWRIERGELVYEVLSLRQADQELVRFRHEGVEAVVERHDGSALLETPVGRLVEMRPAQGDGVGGFRLINQEDRDSAGSRESDDPSDLLFSTFLGGSSFDQGYALSLDPSGNPVVTGYAYSSDFPTTPGAYDESHNGSYDVFVAKLDASGSSLLWSTFLGGSLSDRGYALSLDPSGNPVVTGRTESSDFPTTPGAYDESYNGGDDVFMAKLNATGTSLLWSTFLGGSADDLGRALSLDPSGNAVVTGYTDSSDFPATSGAYDESYNGGYNDGFVAKLDATGTSLLWSTFLGGSADDLAKALSLDASGNPVVTGETWSYDFPTTPGAYDESFNGGHVDAFVVKLDASGSALIWNTLLGGNKWDQGYSLCLDPLGNPVVAGRTQSSNFPTTPGAYDSSYNLFDDGFVAKIDGSGSSLLWSTFLGGNSTDFLNALFLDPSGNPIVTGGTASPNFPTTPGAYDESQNLSFDVFVTKLNVTGSALLYGTYLGGSDGDEGSALFFDPSGNLVVMGSTYSPEFPTTAGAYDESHNGDDDVFVAKLDISGTTGIEGPGEDTGIPLAFALEQNHPNPFNPQTVIGFSLSEGTFVSLKVYNLRGALVRVLLESEYPAGRHEVFWNGENDHRVEVSSGIYFYQLTTSEGTFRRKMLLAR